MISEKIDEGPSETIIHLYNQINSSSLLTLYYSSPCLISSSWRHWRQSIGARRSGSSFLAWVSCATWRHNWWSCTSYPHLALQLSGPVRALPWQHIATVPVPPATASYSFAVCKQAGRPWPPWRSNRREWRTATASHPWTASSCSLRPSYCSGHPCSAGC